MLTPGVAKRCLKQINACCKWALRRGRIKENPFEGMAADIKNPQKRIINPFSNQERKLILKGFHKSGHSHYLHFVEFLLLTGCRPSEAIGLQQKHLYLEDKYILFSEAIVDGHREKSTKTNSQRRFPVNQQLAEILVERLDPSNREALIFPSPQGKPINLTKFREKQWVPVLTAQEINYRPVYNCRHTFITTCIRQQIPIPTIATWVGNSPEIILRHYAGFIESEVPDMGGVEVILANF
jgi:integrase